MTRRNQYSLYLLLSVILLCFVAVMIVLVNRRVAAQGKVTPQGREWTFRLQEVSAFDLTERAREFGEGQRAICGTNSDPNVMVYPRFNSRQPLYGRVSFADPSYKPDPRATYHLALDESGGTGQGYDRLYFDLNQDGDLTDDKVLSVQRNPPKGAVMNYTGMAQQVCFESLAIPLAFGSQGERPLEIMPRLLVWREGYKSLSFVTTKARQGRIRLAGAKYDVLLGHNHITAGWFDNPWTALHVIPAGSTSRPMWMGGDRLIAWHKIGDTFYEFSATPAGDRLTARSYAGPLGVFEVGAGGRQVEVGDVQGSLRSRTTSVAVGEVARDYPALRPVRTCKLPVGDYLPESLTFRLGKLRINLSSNYHTDGKRLNTIDRQWVYGIHIRADKPLVMDFLNPPAVLFVSPARDRRAKRGEPLSVLAVLIDPVQDWMIRHLDDTTGKQRNESIGPDGAQYGYEQDLSLDPKVTIARANGEIVAEGVMPFG
jgi:hypothetical protein